MFRTSKADIDKHVEESLRKTNNETERNLRCLSFAKQYFNIERYQDARRYVSAYLSARPNCPEGHCLLGKVWEKQGRKEAAIEEYTTSLRLDAKQNNLVFKICELYASDDVEIDANSAKFYCNMAKSINPQNPVIFEVKQRLLSLGSGDPCDVMNLLLAELDARPSDVKLRIRLLKHLLQNRMLKEAYAHVEKMESKEGEDLAHNNTQWYEAAAEVLLSYQRSASAQNALGWEFWLLSIAILDRLTSLSLEDIESVRPMSKCVGALFSLDQSLAVAARHLSDCGDKHLVEEFLSHYSGQVCFHLSTLAFKHAQADVLKFKEAVNVTLPLLFAGYHSSPLDLQNLWFNYAGEKSRSFAKRWRREGSYRCSQVGHVLSAAAKDRKSIVLEKANQFSVGLWREQIFKKLFVTREQQSKMKTSFFLNDQRLSEITFRLPDPSELLKYDEEAQLHFPESLHHHIWLNLNNRLSDLRCTVFDGLQYTVRNLKNCAAETLNVLDLQAFVSASTLCVRYNQESRSGPYYNLDKPSVLPSAVTQQLGTIHQNTFFKAAYRMYKNEEDPSVDQLRLTLVDGIKVLRCVDNSLDVKILVSLAQIFAERAKKLTKQSEVEANEARSELYWKVALPILEKLKNNQAVALPPNKLFNYTSKDLSLTEITSHIESGNLFLGTQLMKKKDYEKALRLLEQLKDPYASFHQAKIYQAMADQQTNQNKENVTSEMRSQNIILMSHARDCLYLTLDRLRAPSTDPRHPLNEQLGTEIEEMERLLSRIDPDCTNRNECDGMSDENESSNGSTGDHYVTGFTTNTSTYLNTFRNSTRNHSTPRRSELFKREAKPSPERLDAQLRQLTASKDAAMGNILEHNRLMVDSLRTMVEELKSFKQAVQTLTSTVEELNTMKHGNENLMKIEQSVNELKATVEDLDSVRNISDMLIEIKKEIADMKKDINKTNQLTEEDIYGLANEYGTEYNLNSNLAAYNPTLYPNYPRLPAGAASLYGAPALYPGIYPPLLHPYAGLGLTQPFAADQLAGAATQSSLNFLAQTQTATQTFPKVTTSVAPPVNVVITSSDPLPPAKVNASQPVLSVTIPPQHIKGGVAKPQPHNYQIPLPSTGVATSSPSVLSKPPPSVSTQSILSNVAPPVYSAVSEKPAVNVSLGLQIEKSLDQTFNSSKNASSSSIEEHDPCPDFKPIIPLPDEVPVTTGEENEMPLFTERAKLFRYATDLKEWRERGVGVLKILKNPETKKVRILMRRDQVLKICANHFLTKDMALTPMAKSDRAYIWAAHDYADETVVLEKLCAKFKNGEVAKKFFEAFESAKKGLQEVEVASVAATSQTSLGGFTFTSSFPTFFFGSTPTFKPKTDPVATETETPKTSPFAGFTFGATKKSPATFSTFPLSTPVKKDDEAEEFVPTAEFKPVIPLPELVDVKTGEEDSEILFESRAKLLRFDNNGDTKEWKEKGLGTMTIVKDDRIRLVMRRDQVHKVCCNHQLLKHMEFKFMGNTGKALTWCAKDFSEGVLKQETLTIRFKTEELTNAFLKAIKSAQDSLDENNCVVTKHSEKHLKTEPPKPSGFGDKFKPVKGSWECKNCLVVNDGKANYCVACETPKNDSIPPKKLDDSASGAAFSFGVGGNSTWGNAFKPKEGSWECKSCYLRNDGNVQTCVSCNSPKDGAMVPEEGFKFSFRNEDQKPVGFGDQFKPKEGTWECGACLIRNTPDVVYCSACDSPKDETVPKKEANQGVDLSTGGQTFTFGFPPAQPATKATFTFGQTTPPKAESALAAFSFKPTPVPEKQNTSAEKFVFGSPQKHDFEFTPRSPRRISTGANKDEESDASYVEEECDNIYFKPVVPLPDKVAVKTGEEEEDVMYCHRAKLYRYAGGEWKERGLGDLKILKQKESGKIRVLMRREQVFKICLNHVLNADIKYMQKDEKTWLFSAPDFSEGEIQNDKFCLRFKTAEIAKEFMTAVDAAVNGGPVETAYHPPEETDDDDVIYVGESQSTPEEVQEALRLRLPKNFLSYRQLDDCKCDLCKKSDEYLKDHLDILTYSKNETSKPTTVVTPTSSISPFSITPTPKQDNFSFKTASEGSISTSSPLRDLLSKPPKINETVSSSTTASPQTFGTPGNVFSSPSTFSFAGKGSVSVFGASGTEPKSPFGAPTTGLFGKTTGSLFSNSTSSIFNTPNIFGGKSETPAHTTTPSSPFGAKSEAHTPVVDTNLFEGKLETPVATTTPPVFLGGKNETHTPTTTATPAAPGIFGGKFDTPAPTTTPSGLLGQKSETLTPTPASIFANSDNPTGTSSASVFGSSANIFSVSKGSIFGGAANGNKTIFGSGDAAKAAESPARPIFGASATKTTDLKEEDAAVLDCSTGVSFAALAAKSPDTPFTKPPESSAQFAFAGAGTPVFGAVANESKNKSEEGAGDEEYDPHYDPIVPLPDAIVVSTGEEEETALFNERAKLFRYDDATKEWKERGVGQMKILHHPVNKTFRFLLRREQIHKVVLNQLITPDLDLQPMKTSDKAWVWAGYNYHDDESALEKLAIRFKNCELAQAFHKVAQEVVEKIEQSPKDKEGSGEGAAGPPPADSAQMIPSSVQNDEYEDVSSGDDPHREDYDEEYEEEDDERSIMFSKRCTLSEEVAGEWKVVAMGVLLVYYDPDLYVSRICVSSDKGEVVSNTIIGANTTMQVDKNSCIYRGVEFGGDSLKYRTLKATFGSVAAAEELHSNYLEGLHYALEFDVGDDIAGTTEEETDPLEH